MRAGVYRHYKGSKYLVLGVAHDANADSLFAEPLPFREQATSLGKREVVVYVGLERADKGGTPLVVRTVSDFNELVCWNPACEERGKHTGRTWPTAPRVLCGPCKFTLRPRFEYEG
jgi:hypothetical protein